MKVIFYKDMQSEWRWRLVAANGRIVSDSSEAYTRKTDVKRAWKMVRDAVRTMK